MTATSNRPRGWCFAAQLLFCAAAITLVMTSRFLLGSGLQIFSDEPWGGILYLPRTVEVVVQHSRCVVTDISSLFVVVVSSIVLVALKLTSRSFFSFRRPSSCRVVLSGSVALGRALGEILPPKDSGLGRLQLWLLVWRCDCPHAALVLASMLQLFIRGPGRHYH